MADDRKHIIKDSPMDTITLSNQIQNEISALYQKLRDFASQGRPVYIYGAALCAEALGNSMNCHDISFGGFIVTDLHAYNPAGLCDHKVYSLDEFLKLNNGDANIIIGILSLQKATDVISNLNLHGFTNILYDRKLLTMVTHWEQSSKHINSIVVDDQKYLLQALSQSFEKDTIYICAPSRSIGDNLFIAGLVKAIKENKNVKKVYLILRKKHEIIAELFDSVDGSIVSDELVNVLEFFSLYTQTFRLKNYIYGYFHTDTEWNWIEDHVLPDPYNNMISDFAKYVLDLPLNSTLERVSLGSSDCNCKNAVVLMPHAITFRRLPKFFWEELAKELLLKGIDVYTNVKDDTEELIPGTQRLSMNIKDTAIFCESSLLTISLRSGMCDLLAMTNSNLVVLNTQPDGNSISWSVKNINSRDTILEIECFDDNNLTTIIKKILDTISHYY